VSNYIIAFSKSRIRISKCSYNLNIYYRSFQAHLALPGQKCDEDESDLECSSPDRDDADQMRRRRLVSGDSSAGHGPEDEQ
jgi:hypothetical protein